MLLTRLAFISLASFLFVSIASAEVVCLKITKRGKLVRKVLESECPSRYKEIINTASLIGEQGETGPQGVQGDKGDTGAIGLQGLIGPQGPQGIKGDTGAAGSQGLKGDTGAVGPQGLAGPQGAKGDQGDTGATGPQGLAGPQGVKGDQGDTGAVGPQGVPGTAFNVVSSCSLHDGSISFPATGSPSGYLAGAPEVFLSLSHGYDNFNYRNQSHLLAVAYCPEGKFLLNYGVSAYEENSGSRGRSEFVDSSIDKVGLGSINILLHKFEVPAGDNSAPWQPYFADAGANVSLLCCDID